MLHLDILEVVHNWVLLLQQVKSELPSTFKAFRSQQHRWSSGPANLFRKLVTEIAKNKVCAVEYLGAAIQQITKKINVVCCVLTGYIALKKVLYDI